MTRIPPPGSLPKLPQTVFNMERAPRNQTTPTRWQTIRWWLTIEARRVVALIMVAIGAATTVVGVAVIYWPAALVVGGLCLAAFGLVGINVDDVDDEE